MSDEYTITIRCEHMTRDLTQRSSRIAYAVLRDDAWAVGGTASSLKDHPSTHRDAKAFEKAQMRGNSTRYPGLSPHVIEPRVTLECATCRNRVVALKSKLDAMFERIRDIDAHSVTLSDIRASL